jgi:hypothetical protein
MTEDKTIPKTTDHESLLRPMAGALSVLSIEKESVLGSLYSPLFPVQKLTKTVARYNPNVRTSKSLHSGEQTANG